MTTEPRFFITKIRVFKRKIVAQTVVCSCCSIVFGDQINPSQSRSLSRSYRWLSVSEASSGTCMYVCSRSSFSVVSAVLLHVTHNMRQCGGFVTAISVSISCASDAALLASPCRRRQQLSIFIRGARTGGRASRSFVPRESGRCLRVAAGPLRLTDRRGDR